MSATVEISEEDGEYTAVDSETGATGVGDTRALALAALAVRLGAEEEWADTKWTERVRSLARRSRKRFETEGVSEEDVEDAIAWARSG